MPTRVMRDYRICSNNGGADVIHGKDGEQAVSGRDLEAGVILRELLASGRIWQDWGVQREA